MAALTPLAVLALCVAPALAHDGPPYPILVDEAVAGLTLSIWADPDVGQGTFFYYVEGPLEGLEIEAVSRPLSAPPRDTTGADWSSIEVRELSSPAQTGAPYQLIGELPFAYRGSWRTDFIVRRPDGEGRLSYDLDVTPPGLGLLYLLWYAVPFATAAAIWLRVLVARGSRRDAHAVSYPTPSLPETQS